MRVTLHPIARDGSLPPATPPLPAEAREVVAAFLVLYAAEFAPPWIGYVAESDGVLVGTCAFKSPPRDGAAEIAYFTFPQHEGRGIATAMAERLVQLAHDADPRVRVFAQTLPRTGASTSVLTKLGFVRGADVRHPEDGLVWEWHAPEPGGWAHVRVVGSFAELRETPFADGVNALCWPRTLAGDFGEVAAKLGPGEEIDRLDEDRLTSLSLTPAGQLARDALLADLRLLRDHGLAPELNCIHAYPRDEPDATVPTDVYSFHADSAPVEAATWLCTYFGPASEGLANEDARRKVDDPATRATLLREHGGADDADFAEFLRDHCYDLHYAPAPHAQPYSFGRFHLWRIAVDWPGSPVPPCVHRAPAQRPGESRLLLIS
jgi:RimJ/RimL family protein N-acetyltransferase